MGDHFELLVDRLLTESTLEAALESRNRSILAASSAVNDAKIDLNLMKMGVDDIKFLGKVVECRICHDDDQDSNMETPCSCCGSLKYAHRRCIQRWCNEKGDTTCEICHQQFKPGYTAPPPLFQFGRIPMSFRGNWEISRRDLNSTHLVSMVPSDQNLTTSNYDQYSASATGSLICCRSIAVIFMVLLILRHTLPLVISGNKEYSFPLFLLLLFRIAGVVLPIYFMVRAVALIQRHRRQHRVMVSCIFAWPFVTVRSILMPRPVRLTMKASKQICSLSLSLMSYVYCKNTVASSHLK
ncbi:E3 ubiquitin-protein ligase MARCH3 [Glycine max]|nr:E3 ubiquitin-protein ligase MARCH3 [Glycine max]KAH1190745.1 E3 ubiquitin-protein ligase MARCH3 [Glycine max]